MIVAIVSLKVFWLVIIFVAVFNSLSQRREISAQGHCLQKKLWKSLFGFAQEGICDLEVGCTLSLPAS